MESLGKSMIWWLSALEGKPRERIINFFLFSLSSPGGLEFAKNYVRPKLGKIVLKSTYKEEVLLNLSYFVVNEITIIGSRCGPFGKALKMLKDGFDPSDLIEKKVS